MQEAQGGVCPGSRHSPDDLEDGLADAGRALVGAGDVGEDVVQRGTVARGEAADLVGGGDDGAVVAQRVRQRLEAGGSRQAERRRPFFCSRSKSAIPAFLSYGTAADPQMETQVLRFHDAKPATRITCQKPSVSGKGDSASQACP